MSGIRLFCPCLKQGWDETVLSNLLQCSLVFYTLYYMIGSVCFGAFRLDSFDGLLPFDFKTQAEKSISKYLVNLLSMELTYFTSGILFAIIVRKRVWDYSITVTLIHVILSSADAARPVEFLQQPFFVTHGFMSVFVCLYMFAE
ncbi:transmembrane protein 244-like isoform X5 [Stegostoma tigrinum]|uniref:transmembrane protein 244-like isoform X5 n=1 Tax=Stegostoma tigrinum TaxID=3053191 RepID=UPI00202AC539|nr:transmembrane protein 244-like isoform X5 [Stegostoma tigrinum]